MLHHQEWHALVIADVVQRADVRMRELRDGTRLAVEPFANRRIRRELRRQNFDGDGAVQAESRAP